ncbi:hypothetical protein HPB52_014712 [Rhipicephalus sanguineus]|uniref:Ig-like domain-containing protein n=1 Tax=Rhipicephalus sanguineus TaxID=34632 RepID=A0A9D4Q7D7_RHISA|nr:hypothetical protein HPB52_014712 [Rhipicephalus sanguineus]
MVYTVASSDEGASLTSRQWFRRSMEGDFERLKPDAHDDPALDRVAVAADHTLTLANVSEVDVGFYVCHDNEEPPTRYRMEYLLDGDEQQHKKYLEELQEAYANLDLEGPLQRYNVTTSWDDWEPCDRCGEVGLRKRYGRCQLRTSIDALFVPPGAQASRKREKHGIISVVIYFRATVALNITVPMMGPSCRSALLRRYAMSRQLFAFPDFVQTEYCQEPCAVTWFHNGSKLRPTWSRVSLSAESQEVLFKPLKERDAGIYECTVMGVKMGHLELYVVSANWNQHYRRLEIQEYLAAKRAEKHQVS